MKTFPRLAILLAASVAVQALIPTVALAAEADSETAAESAGDARESGLSSETIIVTGIKGKQAGTGTKTDTPLMETPQSITVIDNEELVRRNALSINQALGYVAGVSPNQRGGMVTRYDQLILR